MCSPHRTFGTSSASKEWNEPHSVSGKYILPCLVLSCSFPHSFSHPLAFSHLSRTCVMAARPLVIVCSGSRPASRSSPESGAIAQFDATRQRGLLSMLTALVAGQRQCCVCQGGVFPPCGSWGLFPPCVPAGSEGVPGE